MEVFVRGVAIGFAIAAPVGPIGVLCIRRSLEAGVLAGFSSGLGAACADAVYAALAACALTAVTRFLAAAAAPLHLLGAAGLIVLGARGALSALRASSTSQRAAHARGFVTTFALTLANPATILSFAAVVAGAAFGTRSPGLAATLALVAGVFVGSALWWAVLCGTVGMVRHAIPARAMRALGLASAAALAAAGLALLVA